MTPPSAPHSWTAEDLLDAAEDLSQPELDSFLKRALALRARRAAPALGDREAELLIRINRGLPPEIRERYSTLRAGAAAGTLTPAEHAELLRCIDEVELYQADRVELMIELARQRGSTLAALMQDLGIRPRLDG